jgi:hypothetical protein
LELSEEEFHRAMTLGKAPGLALQATLPLAWPSVHSPPLQLSPSLHPAWPTLPRSAELASIPAAPAAWTHHPFLPTGSVLHSWAAPPRVPEGQGSHAWSRPLLLWGLLVS